MRESNPSNDRSCCWRGRAGRRPRGQMSGCELIEGWRAWFGAFLLIITFMGERGWAGFPASSRAVAGREGLGLCWGAALGHGDTGQAGLAPWPGYLISFPQPEKLGHLHLLLCLLNDLYLSSRLRVKCKICIQRCWLTCFLYEFLWIAIDFWLWFLKSYF